MKARSVVIDVIPVSSWSKISIIIDSIRKFRCASSNTHKPLRNNCPRKLADDHPELINLSPRELFDLYMCPEFVQRLVDMTNK